MNQVPGPPAAEHAAERGRDRLRAAGRGRQPTRRGWQLGRGLQQASPPTARGAGPSQASIAYKAVNNKESQGVWI